MSCDCNDGVNVFFDPFKHQLKTDVITSMRVYPDYDPDPKGCNLKHYLNQIEESSSGVRLKMCVALRKQEQAITYHLRISGLIFLSAKKCNGMEPKKITLIKSDFSNATPSLSRDLDPACCDFILDCVEQVLKKETLKNKRNPLAPFNVVKDLLKLARSFNGINRYMLCAREYLVRLY